MQVGSLLAFVFSAREEGVTLTARARKHCEALQRAKTAPPAPATDEQIRIPLAGDLNARSVHRCTHWGKLLVANESSGTLSSIAMARRRTSAPPNTTYQSLVQCRWYFGVCCPPPFSSCLLSHACIYRILCGWRRRGLCNGRRTHNANKNFILFHVAYRLVLGKS